MATVQRKKQYVTFSRRKPRGFPDFLGAANLGGMQYCYFYKGVPFPRGRYEFEISTITLPKGFTAVQGDAAPGEGISEFFVMPILIDLVPEDGQPNFPYATWHYCVNPNGGGSVGSIACAKPILDAAGDQVVLFYDDSAGELIPRIKINPDDPEEIGTPRDPNFRYYLLPLLLPNQSICYYLLPEDTDRQGQMIAKWQAKLKKWQAAIKKWQQENGPEEKMPLFFVAVDSEFIFDDTLQIFFSETVNIPDPPEET
jgi:hypothetical protein